MYYMYSFKHAMMIAIDIFAKMPPRARREVDLLPQHDLFRGKYVYMILFGYLVAIT